MTEKQFLEKVDMMMPNLIELIKNRAKKIAQSGCVDLEKYEDNYKLPKMFLSAMGSEITWQYQPINQDRKERAEIKNMERFL